MATKPLEGGTLIGTPGYGTHSFSAPPTNWESDEAIDVGTTYGSPVYAVKSGTIGQSFGSLDSQDPRMAGLRLHLETGGDEFYYAHLSKFAPNIHPGTHVTEGELLGWSGQANGVDHLHFAEQAGYPSYAPNAPVMQYAPGSSAVTPSGGSPAQAGNGAQAPAPSSGGGDVTSGTGCEAGKEMLCGKCHNPNERAGTGGLNPLADCFPWETWGSCCSKERPVRTGAETVGSVGDALKFLFSIRFLEIVGGGLLLLLGVKLLGTQLGVNANVPGVPGA